MIIEVAFTAKLDAFKSTAYCIIINNRYTNKKTRTRTWLTECTLLTSNTIEGLDLIEERWVEIIIIIPN